MWAQRRNDLHPAPNPTHQRAQLTKMGARAHPWTRTYAGWRPGRPSTGSSRWSRAAQPRRPPPATWSGSSPRSSHAGTAYVADQDPSHSGMSHHGAPTRVRRLVPPMSCRFVRADGRPGLRPTGSNGSGVAHCTSVRSCRYSGHEVPVLMVFFVDEPSTGDLATYRPPPRRHFSPSGTHSRLRHRPWASVATPCSSWPSGHCETSAPTPWWGRDDRRCGTGHPPRRIRPHYMTFSRRPPTGMTSVAPVEQLTLCLPRMGPQRSPSIYL